MIKHLSVISLIYILLFVGCFSSNRVAKQNIASLYSPNGTAKQKAVDYKVSREDNNLTLLLKLNSFNVKRNIANFDAKLSLKLYNNVKTTAPLREIIQPVEIRNLKATFIFEATDAYDLIEYIVESDNFTAPIAGYLNIAANESNDIFKQKKQNGTKASYLKKNEALTFKEENITIKYFETTENIALPPYISDVKRLLVVPEITAEIVYNETTFIPKKTGYYLFESNGKQKGALCVAANFPALNDIKPYTLSLRYITKNEELKQLLKQQNLEAAIDSFWMAIGNNKARASKLKQEYLLRIKTSNEHFGSITEGWQTDRGMIYIIFGPPDEVYKITEGEKWYYGQAKIEFKFIRKKVLNNYNYYQLQRNENLALAWHKAVNQWRNGHIKSTEVLE